MKNNINVVDRSLFLYVSRNQVELKDACERAVRELISIEEFLSICNLYKITADQFINMLMTKVKLRINKYDCI